MPNYIQWDPQAQQPLGQANQPQDAGGGGYVQWDGQTPLDTASLAPQALSTDDTIAVSNDWFEAQKELEDRLSRVSSLAAPFSVAPFDASVAGTTTPPRILGDGACGFRRVQGKLTGELSLKVYVEEKFPLSALSPDQIIPSQIDKFPVDVHAVGDIRPQAFTQRFPRPPGAPQGRVPCGASISPPAFVGAGTIGCLIVMQSNQHLCILSNNHVMAASNQGKIGDLIFQPGQRDAMPPGTPQGNAIATLEQFIPLRHGFGNTVDAAVAFTKDTLVSPRHISYRVDPNPTAATVGMSVVKDGRTTGSTLGQVVTVGVNNLSVPYPLAGITAVFNNQIEIAGTGSQFSDQGDSGSLIVAANSKRPVALLFAGGGGVTFAHPIAEVMAAFGGFTFV